MFCLDTAHILDDHITQNLANAVQDILGNWELDSASLTYAIAENGSNFFVILHHSRLNKDYLFWIQFGPLYQ